MIAPSRRHDFLDRRQFLARGDGGDRQVVLGLQVHPEFRGRAEHAGEPQRRVGRDRLLLADQPLDAGAVLQPHGLGQGAGGEAVFGQELLAQMLAGVGEGFAEGGVIVGGHGLVLIPQ